MLEVFNGVYIHPMAKALNLENKTQRYRGSTLSLLAGSSRIKLLWGIDSTYTMANNMYLGIYSSKSGGMLGPANSINIGF